MKKFYLVIGIIVFSPAFCPCQSIVSVFPSSASAGQTLNVTITGSGTHFVSGSATTLQFGFEQCSGTVVNSLLANNDTMLTASVSIPSSFIYNNFHDVEVFDVADGYMVKDYALNVTGGNTYPVTITPNSGAPGQTLNVTITGSGTHFMQGSSSTLDIVLDWSQRVCFQSPGNFTGTPTSNTMLTTTIVIPSNTNAGYYDIMVQGGGDNFPPFQNLFHVTGPTAVNELENEYHLEIAPNPFRSETSLNYSLSHPETVCVEVYDLFGRKMFTKNFINQEAGSHSLTIDAAELTLNSGIFYLRFSAGNGHVTKKILMDR